MTTRKPANRSRAKISPRFSSARVVFDFKSGPEELPFVEVERQLQRQWRAMAASDSPELRAVGEAHLREVEELAAYARLILLDGQLQRSRGGARAAKGRQDMAARLWQTACISAARLLLASGKDARNLAGALAPRFGKDSGTIRRVLKKAGVI